MSASARQFKYTLHGKNSYFSEYFYIYRDSSNYDSYTTHSGTYKNFNAGGNLQYQILLSTGAYGWVDGAWLKIFGEYDQIYFQSGPFSGKQPLSLYLPIDKGALWMYSNSISSSSWMTDSTDDWSYINVGTSFSTGTRLYLKKSFSGADSIAAFEMSVFYRYGIVVYMNGHEVYRDNVEEGPIYSFTEYSGSYSTLSFHSFTRSAYHITSGGGNIVAVMLLLPSGSNTEFDAWLSLYSPSPLYSSGPICYRPLAGDHPFFDMVESTGLTMTSESALSAGSNTLGINGMGFIQTVYASSNQQYILQWQDYTDQLGNQRRYAFTPMTTSKGWYHYGMPPILASTYSFSITGTMTFCEIAFLVCRTDTKGLVYPSSVNRCYINNPCTIRPLSPVPGYVTASDLPSGLSISSATGIISGTPQWTGNSFYTITSEGNSFNLQINVGAPSSISSFSYPGTHQFSENQEIGLKPEVSGAPFTVSIVSGSLPNGVTLNTETGVISGFASTREVTLTLKASNSLGSSQTTLTLRVGNPQTSSFYPSSYEAQQNSYFSISPTSECSGCIYTLESSLPSGVSLDASTGVISGSSSTVVNAWTVTVTRNSPYGSSTTSFVLTIRAGSTKLAPITQFKYEKSKYTLVKGRSFSTKPSVNGDEVSFQVVAGKLPGGLILDQSGEIKGTPLETSSASSVMVRARNSVSKVDVNLEFKVNSMSVGAVVTIILLIVLILAALFVFLFMYQKKKRLGIQSVEDMQKSLPKPVAANANREVNSTATVVINNVGGVVPMGDTGGVMPMGGAGVVPMGSASNGVVPMANAPINNNQSMTNYSAGTTLPMTNPIGTTMPMTNTPINNNQSMTYNPIYQQAPSGIPMNSFRS